MTTILNRSQNRFEIDNNGWKRMNAGRGAADLLREAVSNSFDAEGVTLVQLRIEPGFASIEDDAPGGISDPALVTTVFMTDKSDSPTKRGRKGRGQKELISAAEWAEVDSVGHRVIFTDGREVQTSTRTRGTKVTVKVAAWTQEEVDKAIVYLLRIIPPPGVRFLVNGVPVKPRMVRTSYPANLKTQLAIEGIQKDTYRDSTVNVVNLAKGEREGWIYEMGIPVQPVKTKFHIDIQQRIPLNDNRDVVDSYYLTSVYSLLLEKMIDSLSLGALKHDWVQQALSGWPSTECKKKILQKMFGDLRKLAVKTKDRKANDVAEQHGFKLIDVVALPVALEQTVLTSVVNTVQVATAIEQNTKDILVDPLQADPQGVLTRFMKFLGRNLIQEEVQTEFFQRGKDFTGSLKLAHFKAHNKTIGFNLEAKLPLQNPSDPAMLALVCHEFAHNKTDEHGQDFLEELQRLAGEMASLMLTRRDDIIKLLGTPSAPSVPGKAQITIHCVDCGAPRDIYPQDRHQVSRCEPCTKEARKRRARKRRARERRQTKN